METISIFSCLFVFLNTVFTLLHCFLIRYDTTKTSRNLLKLTKSAVFLLYLASIMMSLTQILPSSTNESIIQMYKDIFQQDVDNNSVCLCTLWWKPCILFYTLGCYFAKFVVMKRMILLVQSPIFQSYRSGYSNMIFVNTKQTNGNGHSAKPQLTSGMKLVMLTYLILLTVIQGVILTNIGGTCEYDKGTQCECILNYDLTVIILAIIHIIFDATALLLFYVQFHATMNMVSDVTTKSLFIQLITICIALISCCSDLIIHVIWLDGTVSKYALSLIVQIDIFIIINCEIFSLSKAQKWLLRLLKIKRFDKYYNELDKDPLNVF